MSIFAEFERDIHRERTIAGIKRAKAAGKTWSRRVSPAIEATVKAHLALGTGILKTARLAGTSSSVVQRIKEEMRTQPGV
jgi:DNA invertase Pin-like site-specific DNA recombinase